MNLAKVSIGVILYKWEKYIPYFLTTLIDQDYQWEIEFLFRDQDKDLSATKYIRENYPEIFEKCIFSSGENLWHSGGHNKLISQMTWDIYFCCSNDMLYSRDFVSWIVNTLVKNEYAQMATCKIRRWNFDEIEKSWNWLLVKKIEKSKTNFLDSCWVWISKHHYFFDIWQGENDTWQYDNVSDVFWPSWAVAVFTKSAIENLKNADWFVFDGENVAHYKNDVDLSYRLNWYWISTIIATNIVVYHDRQVANETEWLFNKIKERKLRGAFANRSSLSGHLTILHKNFSFKLPFSVVVMTLLYELRKFLFILLFETYLLWVYFDFFRNKKNVKKTVKNFENIKKIVAFMKAN